DERGDELPVLPDDDGLADDRVTAQGVLERGRCDVLAAGVTMISFLRPLIFRYPSSSREPRSPVPNHPSWNSLAVASALFQYSRKIGTPLARISPSGAMATETPGSGTPTVPIFDFAGT